MSDDRDGPKQKTSRNSIRKGSKNENHLLEISANGMLTGNDSTANQWLELASGDENADLLR